MIDLVSVDEQKPTNFTKSPLIQTESTETRMKTNQTEDDLVDINGKIWDDTVIWSCGVCKNADASADNNLCVCEGCLRAVHQYCYAITDEEMNGENDWYCIPCKYKRFIIHQLSFLNEIEDKTMFYGKSLNVMYEMISKEMYFDQNMNNTIININGEKVAISLKDIQIFREMCISKSVVLNVMEENIYDIFFNGLSFPKFCFL